MTHPNFVTNGASLEDCHTNFFALADLSGIKWRRLCADSVLCVDPLDDPVLSSYSKCLAADILCVWRRVASRGNNEHHRSALQESSQLNYNKELWIFWYGEQPDLSGLVGPELTADADLGSWETGLSYEARSLLFKALHNLIERCLLARGFARIGRWFVQPHEGAGRDESCELSFGFNFFVHGESTVCASVDVRQHPAVYWLSKHHVATAQGSHSGLKVILSPYSMAGTLTGQSYKESDIAAQRLLNEWNQFFPLPNRDHSKELGHDDEMPSAVEVIVGGVKMKYPSSYVFVVESEEEILNRTFPGTSISQLYAPFGTNSSSTNTNLQTTVKPSPLIGVLTPPTSPCDSSGLAGLHLNSKYNNSNNNQCQIAPDVYHQCQQSALLAAQQKSKSSTRVKNGVWQDSTIPYPRTQVTQTEGSSEEVTGHWDYCDPINHATCACLRCKNKTNQSSASSKSNPSNSNSSGPPGNTTPVTGSTSGSSSGGATSNTGGTTTPAANGSAVSTPATRKTEKSDKEKAQRLRGVTPFHRRSPVTDIIPLDYDTCMTPQTQQFPIGSAPGTPLLGSGSTSFQYNKMNQTLRSTTPSGLPQLHTSLNQPSSLGSPHPGTPIMDSQLSSADPAMPTLSPHPPLSKEEEGPRSEPQPSVSTQSPATVPEPSSNSSMKEKSQTEQLLSPYQSSANSAVENTKPGESSPGQWHAAQGEDVKPAPSQPPPPTPAAPTNNVQITPLAHGLKRPLLPAACHDDSQDELLLSGLLYDYSTVSGPTWDGIGRKRQRLGTAAVGKLWENNNELFGQYPYCRDGQNQAQELDPLPSKPKDPYEFNDEFDEESPSSGAGFRARIDVFVKEEEKPSPTLPSTPDSQTPLPTPIQAPSTPTQQEAPKSNLSATDQAPEASPPTPRNQGSSFTREEDLQVTYRDLENIFETSSSDESGDDQFQTPSTPTSTKLGGGSEEPFSGKSTKSTSCTSGILGAAELTRMFPTPPSLEHNTAPSPSCPLGGTDVAVLETGETILRDRTEAFPDDNASSCEPVKDWSYVFKPQVQQKFVGSLKYSLVTTLPSSCLPSLVISPEYTYKPTWQQQAPNQSSMNGASGTVAPFVPPADRHIPSTGSQFPVLPSEADRLLGPMFPGEPPMDQRSLPMSYELQSPASSASSYLNKHLNSIDNSSTSSPIPEAHSLLVNLVLSDSMLNLFKDHNFASCTLCVCNMNIKGADAGIYLPSSLIPSGTDEPQYKCTCGFSAVVNRHQSHRSGLFYEDEVEISGIQYEALANFRRSLLTVEGNNKRQIGVEGDSAAGTANSIRDKGSIAQVDQVPHNIVDLIKLQCTTIYSSFSLFYKAEILRNFDKSHSQYNALEISDGCEICFQALDTGKQALDNINSNKLDESAKSSCLNKWPYLPAKMPQSSHDIVRLLRSLQPLLHKALQKKTQTLWEATYTVSGPLTWRQFHKLAGRGTEDQCEPQPIPSLLVGYDKDWLALSPYALKYWDKLLLEPYSNTRDVAYIVVAPENDFILTHVRNFFKELSSIYELCKLGRHCPITKVLRDGIMRVGKTAAKKLADEPVDDWFNLIGDGPVASKLKLYAQACRHHLAPHLATQTLDRSLLDLPLPLKPPDKPPAPAASPRPPSTPESSDKEHSTTPKAAELDNQSENLGSASGGTSSAAGVSSQDPWDQDDEQQPPAVVIYMIEPFTYGSTDSDLFRLSSLGLMRCYNQMLRFLPEHIQNTIQLQILTLDSILCLGKSEDENKHNDQLKSLAFSVFSQCHRLLAHQNTVKSLTGFGPAAAQDVFLNSKDERNSGFYRLACSPFTLAPLKDKQTELGEMFGDRREKSSILYCTYCLTEDQRWLLATCTNDKGDLLETCCINVEIPNRTRRKKASSRKVGLHRLLDFILEVLSKSTQAWRLVVGRLGRLGYGELRDWASLLGRKSLLRYSRQLRELCRQCAVLSSPDTPSILSACLVSLEPDSALRIMPDQYTPDDHFTSSCNSCDLSTPEDASCTHILVFPTSATSQSSHITFQQEHIDPLSTTLGDDDIFQALNDDDIAVGQDINDLFRWTESPTQSPGASPRRDSISQPCSPNGGMNGRHSPFHPGGPARGSGSMTNDTQEEPLQLLQQPLALGYYISTAKTGPLPKWFWSSCPHLEGSCPVFLKSALLIHSSSIQQNSDDLLHTNPHIRNYHPLDSNYTTDVLRYVLEGYNALSWLALDPATHDRRSCLPIHIQVLMQLYHAAESMV